MRALLSLSCFTIVCAFQNTSPRFVPRRARSPSLPSTVTNSENNNKNEIKLGDYARIDGPGRSSRDAGDEGASWAPVYGTATNSGTTASKQDPFEVLESLISQEGPSTSTSQRLESYWLNNKGKPSDLPAGSAFRLPLEHQVKRQSVSRVFLTNSEEAALSAKVGTLNKYMEAKSSLARSLNRPPSDAEWAASLGITELQLAKQIDMSNEARSKFVESNVGLVITIAQKFENNGVKMDDLLQEGYFGLIEASNRFDPSKGFKFCTYASWWIRQRIAKIVADHSRAVRLPTHVHYTVNNMKKERKKLEAMLGRKATLSELSSVMEIPVKKLKLYSDAARPILSLSSPLNSGSSKSGSSAAVDSEKTLGDTIACSREGPESHAQAECLRIDLGKIMERGLSVPERKVLELTYGLNKMPSATPDEISSLLSIPRSRVKVIVTRALNKLRHPSKSSVLKDYLVEEGEGGWGMDGTEVQEGFDI